MALDPVCKMEVDENSAEWTSEYKGNTYYFCAPGFKEYFDADTEKYLRGEESVSGNPADPHAHGKS